MSSRALSLLLVVLAPLTAIQADPMRPDTYAEPKAQTAPRPVPEPSFNLSSVYIMDDQRYAVINGQWLTLDDTIHNYRVTDIQPDHVHLRRGGRDRTLNLSQPGTLSITETDEE